MSATATTLRIAVPSLAPSRPSLQALRLASGRVLVARGDPTPEPPASWRQWLLDDAGLGENPLERFPAGPCAHAAWTGGPRRGTWLVPRRCTC